MSTGLPSPHPGRRSAGRRRAVSAAAASIRPASGAQPRWAPSPALGWREIALVALAGVLLAVLTTWPLVLHLPSRIAPDLGDPVRTAWEVAWVGHAMLHNPLHLFDSNAFYPHPLSLAFSDSLLGYGPAAFFGSGTVAALVRYNLLFLFACSLCFVGAYLLARELGLGRLGAAAAGVAFAYAPYRVTEAGHLHVISSGGIALALFLLLRGYRRDSRRLVLAGWLVSAWQISLGFTLGLQFCYLLLVLALILAWQLARSGARRGRAPAEQGAEEPGGRALRTAGRTGAALAPAARAHRRGARGARRRSRSTRRVRTCGSRTSTRRPSARSRKSRPTPPGPPRWSRRPRRTASGARSPRGPANTCTPRTRTCSSPAA